MRGTAARTFDRLSHGSPWSMTYPVLEAMDVLATCLTLIARAGGNHALPPLAGKVAKMLRVAPNRKRRAAWGTPLSALRSPKERGPETKCQQENRNSHEAEASLAPRTTECKLSASMLVQSRPTLPRSSRRPLRLHRDVKSHCFRNPPPLPPTDLPAWSTPVTKCWQASRLYG